MCTIEAFDGLEPILALPAMPLRTAIANGLIDPDKMRQRGVEFLAYTKPQHRYYQGMTVAVHPSGAYLPRKSDDYLRFSRVYSTRVDSQVVVDFKRGIEAQPEWGAARNSTQLHESNATEYLDGSEHMESDNTWDKRLSDDVLSHERKKMARWNKGECLPDGDDLLLFPDRVIAYVLRSRSWACLRIGRDEHDDLYLREIEEQADAWKDLEIPKGYKDIVQSLIQSHSSKDKSKGAHFDLVRDKGKGVILLLHGVPGVGKTATAECVAASTRKPLLPITCGDLGLAPKEVESTLENAFQLAQAWDCVLLLDEADIFLAQRTNQDITRNALVSVFLRVLEYYEGILFLTTNRVGAFDEAFKSRISISLYFAPLDWNVTEKIWRLHIRRVLESELQIQCDLSELIIFASELFQQQVRTFDGMAWNGRQIRNAFQSAIALARSGVQPGSPIKVEKQHFKTVADVSNEFNDYIWRTNSGRSDADIAKELGVRYDPYDAAARRVPVQPQYSQFPPPPPSAPMVYRQAPPSGPAYQSYGPAHTAPQQSMYPNGVTYNTAPQQYGSQAPSQPYAFPSSQPVSQQAQPGPYPANATHFQQPQQAAYPVYAPQQQSGPQTVTQASMANTGSAEQSSLMPAQFTSQQQQYQQQPPHPQQSQQLQ